jgi:hypothetical protein
MFGLFDSAATKLRKRIPGSLGPAFDHMRFGVEALLPATLSKGQRDRVVALVMGEWLHFMSWDGQIELSPADHAYIHHIQKICERFGGEELPLVTMIVETLREAGLMPHGPKI